MPVDDLELMSIRADTLFSYDVHGRMIRNNEPDGDPAPRLFLGCTRNGSVVRFGNAVPETVALRLAAIIGHLPGMDDLRIPAGVLAPVREELARHEPIAGEEGGPAYRFPESIARPSQAVQLTEANVELARDSFPWLLTNLATRQPCFAVVRDGTAASICFSSRIGVDACEAGVETLADFRGRGYASIAAGAWGASVRDSGRIPLYSTTWDNQASQGVARSIGLIMFGSDVSLA